MKANIRERVYSLLKGVPTGKVTTYGDLAKAAGTHPRAVAMYMKYNRDPVNIPCYKVVRSDGSLGGYSSKRGVEEKIELLRKDRIMLKKGKIDLKAHKHDF